ncbi:MAG: hypothetical protein ABIR70_13385 [Bryobacteraceae bacterium]
MPRAYLRPTIHGLRDSNFKIDRAETHLKALVKVVDDLREAKPYVVTTSFDIKKNHLTYRIEMKELPEEVGLIAGEFAYSLRSALDNLAWQLALLVSVNPRRQTEFPILSKKVPGGFGAKTRDIIPEALSILESLQPYVLGDRYKEHPLWILNTLGNLDKHVSIPLHATNLRIRIDGGVPILKHREKGFATELTIPRSERHRAQLHIEPIEILFGRPMDGAGDSFELRLAGFATLHKFVRDQVLPKFTHFFHR